MDIDKLKKMHNIRIDYLERFTRIQVEEDEGKEFYQDLVKLVRLMSNFVKKRKGFQMHIS